MENLNFETNQANWIYRNHEKKELEAKYDSRKSFYKKAFVIYLDANTILLQSYNTIVAHIKNGKFTTYGKYSNTTSRHQKEFKLQFAY